MVGSGLSCESNQTVGVGLCKVRGGVSGPPPLWCGSRVTVVLCRGRGWGLERVGGASAGEKEYSGVRGMMLVDVVDSFHYGVVAVPLLCGVGEAVPILVKWSIVE